MRVIVEEYINAGYIYVNHGLPKRTVEFGDHYAVDLSDSGEVVGVEILDIHAGTFTASEFTQQFQIDDELAEKLEKNIQYVKNIAVKK